MNDLGQMMGLAILLEMILIFFAGLLLGTGIVALLFWLF